MLHEKKHWMMEFSESKHLPTPTVGGEGQQTAPRSDRISRGPNVTVSRVLLD